MTYKLGSLFDGSGGFPLAGSLCGIEPVWASEVEPYPVAVTRSRFPKMKHLGDISKINGAEIEPVDIICAGSPCQDLSVAGLRKGLKHEANGDEETTRSGLFMEFVRIIKEMRKATNGKYPTFALWENVPGAFSSNKGEDFRIVCEELIKIVEPKASMPPVPKNGWSYSDSYCGNGWSLAYRVFDAQYWGVPQRRRRIHLVLDLRGERAREVLFERQGLRGYFAESGTPWKAASCNAENGTHADDCEGSGVAYTLKIRSGCEGGGKGALIQEDKSATLATNNDQYLFQPVEPTGIIDNIGGQAEYGYESKVNGTLSAGCQGAIFYAVENNPTIKQEVFEWHNQDSRITGPIDVACTLNTNANGREGHLVAFAAEPMLASGKDVAGCLMASGYEKLGAQEMFSGDYTVVEGKPVSYGISSYHSNAMLSDNPHSGIYEATTSRTLDLNGGNPSCNQGGIAIVEPSSLYWDGSQICGTLTANNAGGNQRMPDKDNFNCVIALDRASFNQGENAKYDFEISESGIASTLVARGPSAVCCTTGSFMQVTDEVTPTLMARDYKDPNVVAYPAELHDFIADHNADAPHQQDQLQAADGISRPLVAATHGAAGHHTKTVIYTGAHYIVRRLTPTECARLQGFADRWGDIDKKDDFTEEEYLFWKEVRNTHATVIGGKESKEYTKAQMLTWYNKLHTDSAEYKMWGNGIALPPALYCMQGMMDAFGKQTETPEEPKPVATEKETKEAWDSVSKNHENLNRQQIKTLKGQIKSGDPIGALRGLAKILQRKGGKS